jgi:hypothetical protein
MSDVTCLPLGRAGRNFQLSLPAGRQELSMINYLYPLVSPDGSGQAPWSDFTGRAKFEIRNYKQYQLSIFKEQLANNIPRFFVFHKKMV